MITGATKTCSAWFNFKTQEYQSGDPTTDAEASDLLPQEPAAKGLYLLYRELGDDIFDAMIKVLSVSVAINKPLR